jgi:hypothetical protein
MTDTKDLAIIAEENNLPNNKVQELLSQFGESFKAANAVIEDSKQINVTNESQLDDMAAARAARLQLKNIRVEVEKTRKDLKEQSLREGKAIDGMANIIKAVIVPIEERLEQQEKFATIKAAERAANIKSERIEKLAAYVTDPSDYNLDGMTEERFSELLRDCKAAFDAKQAELKKVEDERIAREKEAAEAAEKQRKENERLKAEVEARDKKDAEERKAREEAAAAERAANDKKVARINQATRLGLVWDEKSQSYGKDDFVVSKSDILELIDDEYNDLIDSIATEIERRVEEAEKAARHKREAEEAERQKERNKAEKLEREKREREAAETKAKADADEQKRQALLAPDKEKLMAFASVIDKLELPNVSNREAGKVLDETKDFLDRISNNLRNKAREL